MATDDETTPETSADPAGSGAVVATVDLGEITGRVADTIELIRPALQMDGGDIALVEVDADMNVHVQLHGSCVGCPASMQTLKSGVERILKDRIPEVNEVLAVE